MTGEEARRLFPRALDAELGAEERADFEHALLADSGLAREYAQLRELQYAAAGLKEASPSIDLLSSVQTKLRVRSGGRFYRDRFAERQGRGGYLTWVLAGSFAVLLLGVVWLVVGAELLGR